MKPYVKKVLLCIVGAWIVVFSQLGIPKLFDFDISFRFVIVLLSTLLCVLLVNFKDKKALAKNAFLVIFFIGTAVALIRPVQYTLDEDSHLIHTIGLSDSFPFKYSKEELSDYNQVFKHDAIRNQANYSGEDYWYSVTHKPTKVKGKIIGFDNPAFFPGVVGWNIGKLFSDKIYVSYYLGRITHVLVYAILVFWAIKLSLVYQPVLYLLGVLPSAIYVVSGFHYDYLYYGASLLFIAVLTNVLSGKQKLTMGRGIAFQLIALLFAFSKFPFILVGSLPLVLPKRYYASAKVRWSSGLMFVLILLLSFIYVGIVRVIPTATGVTGNSPGLLYFIRHPLPIIRTLLDMPNVIMTNFIGYPLQYVTHQSAFLITISILAFFIFFFVISTQYNFKLPIYFQVYAMLLFLGIATLMIFAITGDSRAYTLGDILVGGVQGRYYYFMIAIAPIFLGNWLHKYFTIGCLSEVEETRFISLLQYVLVFLNIFTLSVGLYTQL